MLSKVATRSAATAAAGMAIAKSVNPVANFHLNPKMEQIMKPAPALNTQIPVRDIKANAVPKVVDITRYLPYIGRRSL